MGLSQDGLRSALVRTAHRDHVVEAQPPHQAAKRLEVSLLSSVVRVVAPWKSSHHGASDSAGIPIATPRTVTWSALARSRRADAASGLLPPSVNQDEVAPAEGLRPRSDDVEAPRHRGGDVGRSLRGDRERLPGEGATDGQVALRA